MISLDDLRAFVAVAKHESFVRAAEEMLITPPALSRRIKKLEEFVGDPLFERTTQMVDVTPSGRVLLERASVLVRDFDSFKDFAGRFVNDYTTQIKFASMWSTAGSVVPALIRDYTRIHEKSARSGKNCMTSMFPSGVAHRSTICPPNLGFLRVTSERSCCHYLEHRCRGHRISSAFRSYDLS